MTRLDVITGAADSLASAALTASRAAIEIHATGRTLAEDPSCESAVDRAEILKLAQSMAAEVDRLASAALTVRASAGRLEAIGVTSKESNG
jgi:hypothetical protein